MAKNKYDAIMESLQSLNEDSFDITTTDGLSDLQNFELQPEGEILNVTDPEAESQEDIEENPQDFYLNKLVAVCDICQNPSFLTEEDLNEPFTCPYCYSEGTGYSIVGKVTSKDDCSDCEDKQEEDVNVNVDVQPQPEEKVDLDLEEPFDESCKKEEKEKEEIKESTELDINMDNKANVNIQTDETGDVKINVDTQETSSEEELEPISFDDDGAVEGQEITELDDEEAVALDDTIDELDEIQFEDVQMGKLVTDFLKEHFEDVDSYKITKASRTDGNLKVEGIVKFASGNTSSINFIFEGLDTKAQKYSLIGSCSAFGRNKAFKLRGTITEGVIRPSSLSYNFQQKINEQLVRIYGKTEIKG